MQTARFILNKLMPLWLIVFGVVAYLLPSPFTALTLCHLHAGRRNHADEPETDRGIAR